MKWENLKFLMNELEQDIENYKYFSIDFNNAVLETQKGTFRVNCIDNLDRTNVVQSMIARRSILIQLNKNYNKDVVLDSPYSEFEKTFKCLWANNADALSLIYSGTGALKVDFTKYRLLYKLLFILYYYLLHIIMLLYLLISFSSSFFHIFLIYLIIIIILFTK